MLQCWIDLKTVMLTERKPGTKRHVSYDSIDVRYPEQGNPQKQAGDCQELLSGYGVVFWCGENVWELGRGGWWLHNM